MLLAVAAATLYWALERTLLQESEAFLTHKLQVLALIVQRRPLDTDGLEQEVRDEAQISAHSQSPYQLRVLDQHDRLIAETPGMGSGLPVTLFPEAVGAGTDEREWHKSAQIFLLEAASVPLRDGRWTLHAAQDITAQERLLARYRRDLILLLAAGVVLAAALSTWITRRGLRPIAAITATMQRIGAQRLGDRLQRGAWPRELNALATEFDCMLERLQESFERLSQFSADLAHELRTPINTLMGETQVTLTQERTVDEYKRVLHSALEEHARLARMIDSMLFLAQADQSRLRVTPRVLDAKAELQSIAEFYQALADEQGVELRCEGEGQVKADAMLLRRALSNLVSNALKFTPSGGSVMLRIAAESDCHLSLSVSDSGVGVPAEHLSKLGERFFRADPSRTESTGGAGLGLAIVRSIMALHGGKLLLRSQLDAGTTAVLIFPIPEDDSPVILS
jgi:two-component system heavy metal sensor histidine kinase CusS